MIIYINAYNIDYGAEKNTIFSPFYSQENENIYTERQIFMAGSTFGRHFSITTWGESHGKAIGVVVDGVPAGLPLNEDDLAIYLNRRRPGSNAYGTKRNEADAPEILSGIFKGKTTGTPISIMIRNTSQISRDYSNIASIYRPGHADYTFDEKYGFRDYRGGGRSSGRETIGRVAAGAIACKILNELGIEITAYTKAIGPFTAHNDTLTKEAINSSPIYMPDLETSKKAEAFLNDCIKKQDSAGGIVECIVKGMPTGIGEPVFDKLDANLAKALMSIGAVKAVEIGDGVAVSQYTGSVNNDCFYMNDGEVTKQTNHSGGILGGMSDGSNIIMRAHFKPTPSISQPQHTVTNTGEDTTIEIHGRHDPIIVPRAVVVVESMAAITILDLLLDNMSSKMDSIKHFYL